MFTLIEADRSKAPFAHAAVPSDASAFFLDGGFVCEREPDLIFFFSRKSTQANSPPQDRVTLLGIYWESCGVYDAGKSPAEPQIQIYFDFCSDQPQMFF